MRMIGQYRIVLLPGVDERAFVAHMTDVVARDEQLLQATRITRGFDRLVLKAAGEFPHYVWQVTADLMTDAGYDFGQNVSSLQARIKDFGVVTGLESYTPLG